MLYDYNYGIWFIDYSYVISLYDYIIYHNYYIISLYVYDYNFGSRTLQYIYIYTIASLELHFQESIKSEKKTTQGQSCTSSSSTPEPSRLKGRLTCWVASGVLWGVSCGRWTLEEHPAS